jgi:hypothetical protein
MWIRTATGFAADVEPVPVDNCPHVNIVEFHMSALTKVQSTAKLPPVLGMGNIVAGAILLILALIAGLAWVQSLYFGIERSWSDPTNGVCGRMASTEGRFLRQSATIKPLSALLASPISPTNASAPLVVGSDSAGRAVVVACGAVPVAFTHGPELSINHQRMFKTERVGGVQLTVDWSETTVSYAAVVVVMLFLLLLIAVEVLIRWVRRALWGV